MDRNISKQSGQPGGGGSTYPLDVAAALGQLDQALVGDLCAVGYVQALQPPAVLGDGVDGELGDLLVAGDVQGEQVIAIPHEGGETTIGQALAVGQGQALDPVADGQGQYAAVVDPVGQGGQVKALDEVAVGKVGPLERQGMADGGVLVPGGAGGAMPQAVDAVAGPALAGEHAVQQVRRGTQPLEDGDEDLVGQPLDGGQTRLVVGDLHVLQVGHTEGRLGVVGAEEEVRLLVLGGGGGARRGR